MNNLQEIIVGLAVVVLIISTWLIYYFAGRLIYTLFNRWDDEKMRMRVERKQKKHSPTVTKITRSKKSTL